MSSWEKPLSEISTGDATMLVGGGLFVLIMLGLMVVGMIWGD